MTKESFRNLLRDAVKAAVVTKSAHGLRKAAATADLLAGWTDADLDAKYGRTGRKMASLYTRAESREAGAGGGEAHGKSTRSPHSAGKVPAPMK